VDENPADESKHTRSGSSGVLLLMVYLVFAIKLYLLPPQV